MYDELRLLPLTDWATVSNLAVSEDIARELLFEVECGGGDIPDEWKLRLRTVTREDRTVEVLSTQLIVFVSTRTLPQSLDSGTEPLYDCISWDQHEQEWYTAKVFPFNRKGQPFSHAVALCR